MTTIEKKTTTTTGIMTTGATMEAITEATNLLDTRIAGEEAETTVISQEVKVHTKSK